jgi:hypothetical protein
VFIFFVRRRSDRNFPALGTLARARQVSRLGLRLSVHEELVPVVINLFFFVINGEELCLIWRPQARLFNPVYYLPQRLGLFYQGDAFLFKASLRFVNKAETYQSGASDADVVLSVNRL